MREPAPALHRPTLGATLREAARRLQAAGVDGAERDVRVLARHALGLTRSAPLDDQRALSPPEAARLEALIGRRAAREPVSHIVGRVGFWTLELEVTPDVLAPRPETEHVVEALLQASVQRPTGVLVDFGVGSGAIALAFLNERPGWRAVGVDLSPAALKVARRNAQACGLDARLDLVRGNWGACLKGPVDLIAANPPYICPSEYAGLEPEVRLHEPRLALVAGGRGLDAYMALAPDVARLLGAEGVAVFEVGVGQAEEVAGCVHRAGKGAFVCQVHADLTGRDRIVIASRANLGSPA